MKDAPTFSLRRCLYRDYLSYKLAHLSGSKGFGRLHANHAHHTVLTPREARPDLRRLHPETITTLFAANTVDTQAPNWYSRNSVALLALWGSLFTAVKSLNKQSPCVYRMSARVRSFPQQEADGGTWTESSSNKNLSEEKWIPKFCFWYEQPWN